ncbi:hypothetical protein AU665_17800 [Salmonella enterica subsp. enterica serovar Bonariensis]|nr:hypothetical protein [Salmonella enterica subsp. enterica serovar Bonariensis]
MLKFMDGFDQLRGWADVTDGLTKCGYTVTGTPTLEEGRVATQMAVSLPDTASLKRVFTSGATKVVFGFAFRAIGKRHTLVTIKDVATITWNETDGKISAAGGTGTAVLLLDLWYYIEVVLDKTTSTIEVYVNNGLDITAPSPSSANPVTNYEVTWAGVATAQYLLDDFQFIDNQPGKYTDRIGPIQITSRLPMVDVDKEWSPSSGTDHYPLVYNQPPVEGSYIQSNTSGAMDTFLSNTVIPDTQNILAVGMTVLNKKSDVDNRQLGMVMGQKGSTQKEVIDAALSTTEKYSYAVFETNPAGLDWNDERLSEAPFGVAVRP